MKNIREQVHCPQKYAVLFAYDPLLCSSAISALHLITVLVPILLGPCLRESESKLSHPSVYPTPMSPFYLSFILRKRFNIASSIHAQN